MPAPRGLDDFEIGHHLKNGLVIKSAAELSHSCIHHAQQKHVLRRSYGLAKLAFEVSTSDALIRRG